MGNIFFSSFTSLYLSFFLPCSVSEVDLKAVAFSIIIVLSVSLLFQRTLQIILQDIPACCCMKYRLKWEGLSCTGSLFQYLNCKLF